MAVMTFTRRQVTDMLPEFLTRRIATFGPKAKAYAGEVGVSEAAANTLNGALAVRDGYDVKRATYAFRGPYAIHRPAIEKAWEEIVAAGLAEATPDGWRMRPRAIEIGEEMSRRVRAHVRTLPFPAEPTRRAAGVLHPISQRVPATAGRAARVRQTPGGEGEPPSDAMTLSRAAQILWGFRDDCHIPAWEAKGYEGPAFEILSYVWPGPVDVSYTKLPAVGSIEGLEKAMAPRQTRADIEKNVDALVRRGDLVREGDAVRITPQGQKTRDEIEQDTDRRFFANWQLDDAGFARLGDDLRAVIDALPQPEAKT